MVISICFYSTELRVITGNIQTISDMQESILSFFVSFLDSNPGVPKDGYINQTFFATTTDCIKFLYHRITEKD